MTTLSETRAKPLGAYPFAKQVGDFIFLSGTTARQPDGRIAGVEIGADGDVLRDVAAQTRAVLKTIAVTLEAHGATLRDCVDIVVFLVDMADFAAFNAAYSEFFDHTGPTRTTAAVRALPHPDMVVEIKAVAFKPHAKGAGQ